MKITVQDQLLGLKEEQNNENEIEENNSHLELLRSIKDKIIRLEPVVNDNSFPIINWFKSDVNKTVDIPCCFSLGSGNLLCRYLMNYSSVKLMFETYKDIILDGFVDMNFENSEEKALKVLNDFFNGDYKSPDEMDYFKYLKQTGIINLAINLVEYKLHPIGMLTFYPFLAMKLGSKIIGEKAEEKVSEWYWKCNKTCYALRSGAYNDYFKDIMIGLKKLKPFYDGKKPCKYGLIPNTLEEEFYDLNIHMKNL